MAFETGCSQAIRPKDHEPWTMGSSLLLGIDGLIVDRVLLDDSGRRVVHCSTDPGGGWVVPGLPTAVVVAEGLGNDPAAGCADRTGSTIVVVAQTEMALSGAGCAIGRCSPRSSPSRSRRGPGSPPEPVSRRPCRSAITCRPVSSVAAELDMDWRIAHDAFVAYAEQVLPDTPPPVRVLGHGRNPPREGQVRDRPGRPGPRPGSTGSTPAWSI